MRPYGIVLVSAPDFKFSRWDDVGIVPYDITIGNIVGCAALCAPFTPILDAPERTVGDAGPYTSS